MRYWIFVVIVLCLCISAVLLVRYESPLRSTSVDSVATVGSTEKTGATMAQLEMRLAVLERRVAGLERGNQHEFVQVK